MTQFLSPLHFGSLDWSRVWTLWRVGPLVSVDCTVSEPRVHRPTPALDSLEQRKSCGLEVLGYCGKALSLHQELRPEQSLACHKGQVQRP